MNAPSKRIANAVLEGWGLRREPSRWHITVNREELARRRSDLTEAEIRHVERTLNDYGGMLNPPNLKRGFLGGVGGFITFVASGTVIAEQGASDLIATSAAGALSVSVIAAAAIRPGALKAHRLYKDLQASLRRRAIEFSDSELDLLDRLQEAATQAQEKYDELKQLDPDSAGPPLELDEEALAIKQRIYAAARLRSAYTGAEGDGRTLNSLSDVLAAASDSVDALEAYGQRLTQVLETLREIERLKVASDASGELLDLVTERGLDDFHDSAVERSTADLVARQEGLQYLVKMLDQDVEHLRDGSDE